MKLNEPMPPTAIPPAIVATRRSHRIPILDDEGNVAQVTDPAKVTRHFAGARADAIARTLAAVSPASAREGGPVYWVKSRAGGWVVVDQDGRPMSEPVRTQSDAVIHAKELAHGAGSAHIIVHAEDGSMSSEFFYRREERPLAAAEEEEEEEERR